MHERHFYHYVDTYMCDIAGVCVCGLANNNNNYDDILSCNIIKSVDLAIM